MPVMQENGPLYILAQMAYRKNISCQDAIFVSMEAIRSILRDGNSAYLSLYDLEKACDSIEHPILLRSLFHAGVNAKPWRLVRDWYIQHSLCSSQDWVNYVNIYSHTPWRAARFGSVTLYLLFSHHG